MTLTYKTMKRKDFSWCNVIEVASRTGWPGTSDPRTGPRLDKYELELRELKARTAIFTTGNALAVRASYGAGSKTTVGNCGRFWVSRIKSTPKKTRKRT